MARSRQKESALNYAEDADVSRLQAIPWQPCWFRCLSAAAKIRHAQLTPIKCCLCGRRVLGRGTETFCGSFPGTSDRICSAAPKRYYKITLLQLEDTHFFPSFTPDRNLLKWEKTQSFPLAPGTLADAGGLSWPAARALCASLRESSARAPASPIQAAGHYAS